MWYRSRNYNVPTRDLFVNGSAPTRPTTERARSAPTEGRSNRLDVSDVERRLCIVRRSRSRRAYASSDTHDVDVIQMSPPVPPLPPAASPPCPAYPTFELLRTPKHEQHIIEALVAELIDTVAFPRALEESG